MNNGKMEKFVHGGDIYSANSPLGYWLDFSANINPLGMPGSVQQALQKNLGELVHYPEPRGMALRKMLAEAYGLSEAEVVLGNGAAELFYVYFHAVRPSKVLLPVPSFSEYERAARCSGTEIAYFYLQESENFALDFAKLQAAAEDCQAVVLGNPNNPTGGLLRTEALRAFAAWLQERGKQLLLDESFLLFRQDWQEYSGCSLLKEFDNVLVISSMTKLYAIPGLRLGYALVPPAMAALLDAHKDVWNVNSLALAAGKAALADKEFLLVSRRAVAERIAVFEAALNKFTKLQWAKPTVNFVLLNIEKYGLTSGQLRAAMMEKGILIRDCSNYPGLDERFVRVAIRSPEENDIMLQALRECLEG